MMSLPNQSPSVPLKIVTTAIPPNQQFDWQTFLAALPQLMQVLTISGSFFWSDTTLPTTNIGPGFLNGDTLYVWDTGLGKYILMPVDASQITGDFTPEQLGYILSPTEPDHNKYNFWLDTSSGIPLYMKVWNPFTNKWIGILSDWTTQISNRPVGMIPPSGNSGFGTTADRPTPVNSYTTYFDTDINCALVYYAGSWHTLDGSPGDVKYVKAATLAQALIQNPGWIQDPDSKNRFIIAANDIAVGGIGPRPYGDLSNLEALDMSNLPATLVLGNTVLTNMDDAGAGFNVYTFSTINGDTRNFANPAGGQECLPVYIAYWCLVKT